LRQLLAHADAALYRAKFAGRNCVVLYDTMHAVGIKREAVGEMPQPPHFPLTANR
jgi:predicted signal transduction protein with EAL and GGDEF domain